MRLSAVLVLAILSTTFAGLSGKAFGQEITVETSADVHDGRFFGEGAVRIIIEDKNADDSASDEIEVETEIDGVGDSFTIPDTSDGSQRFEFFMMHVDSFLNDTIGGYPELDGIADVPTVITFGAGADIDTGDSLFVDALIEITYGDESIMIDYEETVSALMLDRDSYGTTSYVYVSVVDQDANLNPTENDVFTVDPGNPPNDDLLDLDGGTLEDAIVFRETGDNTAVFEGRYLLGDSILIASESLMLTLFDKSNYNVTLDAQENDSNNVDALSFTVGNTDGTIEVGGGQGVVVTWDPVLGADKDSYTVGESVRLTITDQDANTDSTKADSIQLRVASGESEIEISAIETGSNTSVFEAGFNLAEETDANVGAIAPVGSATITYTDERPADYFDKLQAGHDPEKDFTLEIDVQLPDKTGIEATDVTVPVAQDATGGNGPYSVGDSVTLSTTISNNNDEPQPFVALIEVRDNYGVTVFLALRSGTLEPIGSTDIGVLWQPDQAGTFGVRTFVITDIVGGQVLSPVASSEITVNQT
jgi:hypothetical protein